jgi:putative nucleotide binding protein
MIEDAIIALIDNNEDRFVDFYNNATPITTRLHKLELLPGVGKKYLWDIIKQRKSRPFTSFEDISERVKISDPRKAIVRRILIELKSTEEKYYLFLSHPRQKDLMSRGFSSPGGSQRPSYGSRRSY